MFATTWMNMEGIMLSETVKESREREKETLSSIIYMWNLKQKTKKRNVDLIETVAARG